MTQALPERTIVPPPRSEHLSEVVAELAGRETRPALVKADGSRIELPAEVFDVLHDVVAAMASGMAITVVPHHMIMTTGEAASILGVSRPTLVRLLESGEIPYEQPGRHRRIRLTDLLEYQERVRRDRASHLAEMVRVSEEAGLYELDDTIPFERRPRD